MPKEIERKFLVKGDFMPFVSEKHEIKQGFLSSVPERTVRVRIKDKKGYLTIKGIGNKSGTTRYEFEKEIPYTDAQDLLKICEDGIIEKIRYIVPTNSNLFFEVDVFYGANKGLIIAEIELPSEETKFEKPNWLGKEVTGDVRYFNSNLKNIPFKLWKK